MMLVSYEKEEKNQRKIDRRSVDLTMISVITILDGN